MPIYTYTTIDDPLATNGTRAFGINASGQIVGTYQDNTGLHGFLLSGGTYTTLDDPLATKQSPFVDTEALGINDLGQIVGTYQDNTGGFHGFLLSGGTYTTIDVPSAATGETFVTGINATGQIVGTYADATGLHGFLHLPGNGLYATIDDPLATNGTQAFGINNMAVRAPQNHVGGRSRRWRRVREGGFEEAVQAGGILIGPDDLARGVDARGHGTKGGQGIVNGGVEAVEVKGFASGSQTAPLLVAPHACCGVVSNGCCDEVYNISNNNIINATSLGTVGLNWQFSGVGNFSGLGESDMLLRNSNTGGLEVYDISNNQITNAAFIGTVIGSHDLSAATAGGAAGLDYRLAPGTVVGFALAGGGTNWSLAQGIGGGKSDAFQAGVYGTARSGPAYLAAALTYTNHWMSTDRFAFAGDHLSASFNAQSFGGRVEGGYRFATIYGGLTPYAAIQAQSFHTPSYNESDLTSGGFGLAFNSRSASDTRSELGGRFDRLLLLNPEAALTLRARVAWAHDWISDPSLAALFQTLPGASFVVNGATPAKNSALTSAGAEYRLANGVVLLAKFDGEFASHSSTYAGTGTVRYTW